VVRNRPFSTRKEDQDGDGAAPEHVRGAFGIHS
jgi:hypothetical protein